MHAQEVVEHATLLEACIHSGCQALQAGRTCSTPRTQLLSDEPSQQRNAATSHAQCGSEPSRAHAWLRRRVHAPSSRISPRRCALRAAVMVGKCCGHSCAIACTGSQAPGVSALPGKHRSIRQLCCPGTVTGSVHAASHHRQQGCTICTQPHVRWHGRWYQGHPWWT